MKERMLRGELYLARSEEHTSELQSQSNLVCRLLLEKKKNHDEPDNRRWSGDLTVRSRPLRRDRSLGLSPLPLRSYGAVVESSRSDWFCRCSNLSRR